MEKRNYYGELAQQQIRANQQSSLNRSSEKLLNILLSKKHNEYMDIINEFKFFNSDNNLDEELKEDVIGRLVQYIEYCKDNNMSLMGKLADCSFKIDKENSNMITVTGKDNISTLYLNGNDIYSEYAEVSSRRVHYRKPGKYNVPVELIKTVYLVDGEDINEFLTVKKVKNSEISDEILLDIINSYANKYGYIVLDKFTIAKNNVEKVPTFEDVLKDEKELKEYIIPGTNGKLSDDYPEGFYETYLDWRDYNHYALDTESKSENKEDLLKNASEFNKKALKVFSLVSEAKKRYDNSQKDEEVVTYRTI